jgi:phage virion morphogenesis protein
MPITLTGDFATLDAWAKQIGKFTNQTVPRQVAKQLADEALRLVDQGFEQEKDPYGNKWAAKKVPNGKPVLRGRKGRLRRYKRRSFSAIGFTIGSNAPYAGYHQHGTGLHGPKGRKYTIRARQTAYLKFKTSDGKWVYRRQVEHPGVPRRAMVPIGGNLPAKWGRQFTRIAVAAFRQVLSG